ncbi:MAG TPA: hypothetical protein VGD29_02290 [Actinoplanes sp.]
MRLLAATAVSQVGNVVAVLTRPWFVLETTGSAARDLRPPLPSGGRPPQGLRRASSGNGAASGRR